MLSASLLISVTIPLPTNVWPSLTYGFHVVNNETNAQSVVEKLRALLIFGVNNRRYKDIYDMYYLKDELKLEKFLRYIDLLIFKDGTMRENTMDDIVRRLEISFKDKNFLKRISTSRQRWIDEDIEVIAKGIIEFYKGLSLL